MRDRGAPRVVYRDEHLLVLEKPAHLPTTSPGGGPCLAADAARLDPTAERLHPTSRLDAPVTGLVTFARTVEGNRALLEARAAGRYARAYLALVGRPPDPSPGVWAWAIGLEPRDVRLRRALPLGSAGGRPAETHQRVLAFEPSVALLELSPRTGRTHQLRVHAAAAGTPLLGDTAYGGPRRVVLGDGRVVAVPRVMLHCHRLALPRIGAVGGVELVSPAPPDLVAVWTALASGGPFPVDLGSAVSAPCPRPAPGR